MGECGMTIASRLYEGTVTHRRFRPKSHRLRYDVYSMLIDLDELEALDSELPGFSYNRPGLMAFLDKDHGPLDGSPLRPWVESKLREADIEAPCGRVTLLCYPRLFGYVFNPLSVFFCYDANGVLIATLYEVCNTYSERHTYVIPLADDGHKVIRQACPKHHYVSPFIDMTGQYRFSVLPPEESVRIAIRHESDGDLILAASFSGEARPLTGRSMMRCLILFPLQSLKVVAGIHFEALKMWVRGFPVFTHVPAKARVASSVHMAGTKKGMST